MPAYSLASRQRRRANRAADEADGSQAALSPVHAQLMTMQRQAGNKAVTSLLGNEGPDTLARASNIPLGKLRAGRTAKEDLKRLFVADTYSKIISALKDFQDTPEIATGVAVVGLIDYWMSKYGNETKPKYRNRRATLEDVRATVWRDVGKLRAQAEYTKDFTGGEGRWFPLQAPSPMTKMGGHGLAKKLAQGQTSTFEGTGDEALELVKKYKLTEAEITAIRTYTMSDYKYINPSTASNVGWLRGNMAKAGSAFNAAAGEKALLSEGRMQAGMMVDAVSKLPLWSGTLYRGERVSAKQFNERYAGKSEYPQNTFGSASKNFSTAQKFANGEGDDTPGTDQDISVFIYYHVTNGRDISKLSAVGSEGEVSILPGTRFKVDQMDRLPSGPTGNKDVPAKTWYVIILTQQSAPGHARGGRARSSKAG
jgi:hypothetical protein